MTRPCVLLTNPIETAAHARLAARADVRTAPSTDLDTLRVQARDADIVIVRSPLPDDVFDHAPRMIAAVRHGAGVDMIPVQAATQAGVMVANAPGANAQTVAEYVIAQMLRLARRLDRVESALRDPAQGWTQARAFADGGRDLSGSTLGIVGAGAIGEALARIASAGFGMRVLGYRRQLDRVATPMQPCALDPLLQQADWIVLTCPLTDETRGLMGPMQFGRMKPGAVLVNVSRGPVVDEAALIAALESGRLGGAVLDVHTVQPLPADAAIRRVDNVLLSPHLAGITVDSMRRMSALVVDQVLAMLDGHPPAHFINPSVWATRRPGRFAPVHRASAPDLAASAPGAPPASETP